MPEQFAFDEGRGHRAAVHGQEGLVPPPAQPVDGLGGELLARPALAREQHARLRRGDARDQVVHALHLGRAAHQAAEAAELAQLTTQALHLGLEFARANHAGEDALEAGPVGRFAQVVERSFAQRLDGGIHRGVPGDDDDLALGGNRLVAQQLEAVPVRQAEVHEHDVGVPLGEALAGVGEAPGFADFEALALDEDAEAVAESRIVVDDHGRETGRDPARRPHSPGLGLHVPSPFLGSVKQNRAPFDPSLSPQMRPPWRRTILAAIASPRPVPSY